MAKTIRPWNVDQRWLLPPSVHELVPAGDLSHVVRETVRESLDLSEILEEYSEQRGYPPSPAKACRERVDFMAVTAQQKPEHRTVSDFGTRHLQRLAELFVALDGSKIKANASKHKAMSYDRMLKSEAELRAEVEQRLAQAEAEDEAEDAEFGPDKTGEELLAWVTNLRKLAAA